ncbi:hypothetical protein HYPSUDRAFT_1002740 [Hypholoma sublateritium FD-334 SS-4]|uniref:F-box domain-containing protein n=1 Tax=Hypholoma sublateritium (strain FD-334 SS-4) TaxID=945553 RepID=A0A0D2M3P9_HYPSF|nr:hypothetical protein HYPSUDRAFT_1002740 [Hypholoma sublateritium FD-334 SS-4]
MQHLQPICLPKLKQLCLFFDPNDCIAIMHFIKTPPDCALQCIASRQFRASLEESFQQAQDVAEKSCTGLVRRLSRYSRKYFQHRVPTTLMLHSEDCELGITTCPRDDFGGFHLQIAQDLLDFTENTKAAFLSEFTLPEFHHVTDLLLQIFDFECLPAVSELLPFLSLLPSLQVLTVCICDIRFFDILKKELDPPRRMLSSLKTIKIQPNNMSDTGLTKVDEILATSEFADALNKDGYPVEVVCSQ